MNEPGTSNRLSNGDGTGVTSEKGHSVALPTGLIRTIVLLGVAITGSICQEPQGQPPVFRAEAYVVPLPVTVSRRTWYGGSKPVTNLDAADLEISLENNVYVPIQLDPDPKTPGRYLLSFTPPDHLRDGKPRQVQLRIKKRYSITVTMTLPPPSVPEATGDGRSYRDKAVN